jgi:hypothetical protein
MQKCRHGGGRVDPNAQNRIQKISSGANGGITQGPRRTVRSIKAVRVDLHIPLRRNLPVTPTDYRLINFLHISAKRKTVTRAKNCTQKQNKNDVSHRSDRSHHDGLEASMSFVEPLSMYRARTVCASGA